MKNRYSGKWFDVFMASIDAEQTAREVEFVTAQLPVSEYPSILDICCGEGRHANRLSGFGYRIVGFDRDAGMIRRARDAAWSANPPEFFVETLDGIANLAGPFDGGLLLWQSFGMGDDEQNSVQLSAIGGMLKPAGRLVIDLYHRAFFEAHQGERRGERAGVAFREYKQVDADGRLRVSLDYEDESLTDVFEWRIYDPVEFKALAEKGGFRCVLSCREFDAEKPPAPDCPRVQYVLERFG